MLHKEHAAATPLDNTDGAIRVVRGDMVQLAGWAADFWAAAVKVQGGSVTFRCPGPGGRTPAERTASVRRVLRIIPGGSVMPATR